MADSEPFFWTEEYNDQPYVPVGMKRKARTRKMEFVGWGSKPLIEFLESIGTDTSKHISQYDVTDIIKKYVNDHNLHHPTKKKRILCDEWLLSLFGRKTISRIKIYDMLDAHFSENLVDSDNDSFYSAEEEHNVCELPKYLGSERKTHSKKKVLEAPKSCFAAIIPDNIKLVYLKRSLVQDLLKNPETFEGKMVGSFVRIKSDPNDYLQKNSHMLVQVTGLRKPFGIDDKNGKILLQVSNFIKDVCVSMLSNDNFSKKECDDLCQRVRDGLIKRPTIVELQEKVQVLHEDITKHWLLGEVALLQKHIDQANEKGWRKEMFEYLERRQLLQTPEEQSRILNNIPNVAADEIEVESTTLGYTDDLTEGNHASPKSTPSGALEIPICDLAGNGTATSISFNTNSAGNQTAFVMSKQNNGTDCQPFAFIEDKEEQKRPAEILRENGGEMHPMNAEEKGRSQGVIDVQVIYLSDDDEEGDPVDSGEIVDYDLGDLIWHYADPQGDIQGPFPIISLKRWWDADYFPSDFKVWKTGHSPREAVYLSDILHRIFPN